VAKNGICILGSTGTVGESALAVIKRHDFKIIALSAATSFDKLYQQCCTYQPLYAVLVDEKAAAILQSRLKEVNVKTQVLAGATGLKTIVQHPKVDKVVAAIVGASGLGPVWWATQAGKQVLIANKEALVMAGPLLLAKARLTGARFLPVDSEHNAVLQCLSADYVVGTPPKDVAYITLTASGGPFLNVPRLAFADISPEQACRHPHWRMGPKITLDCATLMNKGLEVIEACYLFGLKSEAVKVVIHPQSVIHSFVTYQDGAVLAQLAEPDMQIPLAYCLAWPNRVTSGAKTLDLSTMGPLTFLPPDDKKFPCLALAYQAIALGQGAPTVLNASNEVAGNAFLNGQLTFDKIPSVIEAVLQKLFDLPAKTLESILAADKLAREQTLNLIKQKSQ